MRSALLLATSILLLAASHPGDATAASFDCTKAQKPDEIAICSNPTLSALDSEMGGLWFAYNSVPLLMGASGARSDDAHAFLAARAQCGASVACLEKLYAARIQALRANLKNVLGSLSGNGAAPPPAASNGLPGPVEATIGGYGDECRKQGGRLAGGQPSIMSADFDGDSVMDYLLNPQTLDCDGAATAFCGNGGCNMEIAVSTTDYQHPIKVMGGSPTIAQGAEAIAVEIWVDGSNCNVANYEKACWVTYSWKNGKMSESFKARALPK